jgi:hypothetical protein
VDRWTTIGLRKFNEGRLPYPPEDGPVGWDENRPQLGAEDCERGAGAFHPPLLAEGAGWFCLENLCQPP